MNLIPKLAELLGVEIGEPFEITSVIHVKGNYFYFSETELLEHVEGKTPDYAQYRVLADLIYGDKKVVKLPFKPKKDDLYFCVKWDGDTLYTGDYVWDGRSYVDYLMMYSGNVFRTKAEAEKHKYEIYEKLTGKKWGGEQ